MNSRQRKGAALYLTVLSNALIVGLLGLAALTVVRIERRANTTSTDMIEAQLNAQSAVEHAMLTIKNDATWRTKFVNNAETSPWTLGNGSIRWKLVDVDGDLSDDVNDTVDVYGIGQVGAATWVETCTLTPHVSVPSNLLLNGDCESGTDNWSINNGALLASSTADPHGGAACLHVYNRPNYWTKPAHDLTSAELQSGSTYNVSVWVKINSGQDITPRLVVDSSVEGRQVFAADSTACAAGVWTEVSGSITPTWTGTVSYANFRVATQTSHELWIDDASVVEQSGGGSSQMTPVAGSYRRAAYP